MRRYAIARASVVALAATLPLAFAGAAHACPACYGEATGPLIDAARARTTVGEVMNALADVLGRCDTAVV